MEPPETSPSEPPPRASTLKKALVVLGAVAALLLVGRSAGAYLPQFAAWVEQQGALGPVIFIAGYVAATVIAAPGSILTLAAGAIFGVGAGTLYALTGATLGASAAFLVARYVARSRVEERIGSDPRFAAIDRAVEKQGRRLVFLLRLSPVFPFNLLNYALGLTSVRFIDYLVASIGMLPATLLYVYYGKIAGDVAAAAGGASPEGNAASYALTVAGVVATAVVATAVARIARRALDEATDD